MDDFPPPFDNTIERIAFERRIKFGHSPEFLTATDAPQQLNTHLNSKTNPAFETA